MADKGKIRRGIKNLQHIKTWQLVVLLIIALVVAGTFLRLNNIGMIERRDAVISADQQGNEDVIIQRLYDLQRYVSAHMNTNLGEGVYLEASYTKAEQAWLATQYGDRNPNGNVFVKADATCAPRFASWSMAYVLCVRGELDKYPPADGAEGVKNKPSEAPYIHNFASPLWSPDFAGWAVLVCALIAVLIIIRLISLGVLRLMLRSRYKDI